MDSINFTNKLMLHFNSFFLSFIIFTCGYSYGMTKGNSTERCIRVAAIAIVEGISSPCIASSDGSLMECPLNTRTVSDIQKIQAPDGVIKVYASKVDVTKNPQAKPIAVINLGSVMNVILIFIPHQQGYKILQIQDSAIPIGSIGLLNCTNNKIIYQTGTNQSVLLKSGMQGIITSKNIEGFQIKIGIQSNNGEIKLIRNTVWQISNEQREFVFIYGDALATKFHHLTDYKKNIQ